jgi:hypothetical protein
VRNWGERSVRSRRRAERPRHSGTVPNAALTISRSPDHAEPAPDRPSRTRLTPTADINEPGQHPIAADPPRELIQANDSPGHPCGTF